MSDQPAPGGRREARIAALTAAREFLSGVPDEDSTPAVEIIRMMVTANSPRTVEKTPRVPLVKADPQVVADYFAATGLNRKQLAQAAGVSTSVIATVQNPKGDHWSQTTFEVKQGMIAQWIHDHAAEVEAERIAVAERNAARQAKEQARTERRTAREARRAEAQAAAAQPAPKANPKDQTSGSVTAARRRPRKSQDAAVATA